MGLIERIKRLIWKDNVPKKKELSQVKPNEPDLLDKVNLHQDMKALKTLALYGQVLDNQIILRYGLCRQNIEGSDSCSLSKTQMSLMQEAELIFLSRAPNDQVCDYLKHLDEEKGLLGTIATNGIEHGLECSSSFYQRYGMDCLVNDYRNLKLKRNELSDCEEDAMSVDKQMKKINGQIRQQAECGCQRIENVQSEFKETQKGVAKIPELLLRFSTFSPKEKNEKRMSIQKQSKTF